MPRRPRVTLAILTALVTIAATPAALAHEFWIMPDAFRPAPGSLVRSRLVHGERLRGDTVPRNNASLDRFELVQADRLTPVLGADQSSVSYLRPALAGPATIVYQSAEYFQTLPAEGFESYLAEEKLDAAINSRREQGESDTPGREVYIRCAKALLSVVDPESKPTDESNPAVTPIDAPVGLPFEIVLTTPEPAASDTPHETATPARMTATVLFNGLPDPGVRVVRTSDQDPDTLLEAVTDQDGKVTFDTSHTGVWIITALRIERTTAREDADWKSYWASLTFEITP